LQRAAFNAHLVSRKFFFSSVLLSSLELSDTKVYEPSIRALLGTFHANALDIASTPNPESGIRTFFFFFINLQLLEKRSTANFAPFALDREPYTLDLIPKIRIITPHT